MKRTTGSRALALVLAFFTLCTVIPFSVFADGESTPDITQYNDFLTSLTTLEGYADAYVREHSGEDAIALVINYIRCGIEKYTSGTWTTFCGEEKVAFTNYVTEQDAANGTTAGKLRNLGGFTLPNGNEVEFGHMFGCMDMAYHTGNQNTADLGSWAGDICDLLQLTTNAGVTGTVEDMAYEIRTNNDKYFLYDAPEVHSFGILDLYGDLDAFYILRKIGNGTTISSVMKNYFTVNLTDAVRAKFFLENRFDGVTGKEAIRDAIYNTYCANEGIRTLEGTYIPDGVNADLRMACCYAFADYLYETSREQLDNPYYKVFSSSSSVLAPGITQEIKMAMTADNKQIVYYIAKADVSRGDVGVYANYNDNDGSAWKMSRVTDQMAAAARKHTDPSDAANYIPNYSTVVGVNADFYNMSNGCPAGALVMGGVEYHGLGGENFFAILKDGTPIIGGADEWNAYKNEIEEAVGASMWLVKDGKIAVNTTSDYYNSRASRTCVGITYDGQVVLMVLDGRQEPFSAGGSGIEIAQIMLDAGCIAAVNLDGGGSSTFAAKGEGEENVSVVNRPSDGYERSVSSSLLIVSTAKPSTEFDHAVISADYDYLSVGTELAVKAYGATSTGGAIDIPEGATLRVSDATIGKIENGIFTAIAVGDVQVQLIAADGTLLGAKTLHVVEPTELKFTKDSINAVYGEPSELPIEATYNGNVVKINSSNVVFGYLKITLQSIGEIEGGSVNTTKTELVFEYPEAGVISGFTFTPAASSSLRTLTIGAILQSKLGEFQQLVNAEYVKAYQEAKKNGYSDEQAAIQAQNAAISVALASATKTTVYLYRSDEANFDFNNATGGNGLFAWRREVPDSSYSWGEGVYYLVNSDANASAVYTFAVDMSKMPIPDKLTSLLYMLPGGDQEGRTAWDFLLQLAERISPLTTVTITLNVPEGVTIDTSSMRLANEYFTLTSATTEGNKLTVVCNFIAQGEPINPATANPLCVLSGLRLIMSDGAAWDSDGLLDISVSGDLSYDIYAHFHVLKSLASQEEYQIKYGLYPYDNSENLAGDYGAHFANNIADFTDNFKVKKNVKDGWARENGVWYYWRNGEALTGIHKLPSYVSGETGKYWYIFDENGVCGDKFTGKFENDGKSYYARMGELVSGWISIADSDGQSYFYYFDTSDYTMYTGVRTVRGLTYTFNDQGKLVRGAFRTDANGTKYFVAGESWFRRFVTLEEGTYWIDVNGYVAYGNAHTVTDNVKDVTWYHFDETTGLMTGLCNGFFDYRGELYYCDENGKTFYGVIKTDRGLIYSATRGKVYVNMSCYVDSSTAQKDCALEIGKYRCDENGLIVGNGFAVIDGERYYFNDYVRVKGFIKIGDDYYLFNAGNGKMYCDATMWVGANDYGVESGMHYFDADGKMFIPNLETGVKKIIEENGKLYFTIDGVKMTNGLNEFEGNLYYSQTNGELVRGTTIWASQKNGLIPELGYWRYFDENGKLLRTGFVTGGDGYVYYYENDALVRGFTKIGNDYYMFNAGSGKLYRDATMWVGANSYGVETGMHYFAADGKMFVPNLETGVKKIIEENGKLYFTIDGVKMTNGLNEFEGNLYYSLTSGELVRGAAIWASQKNGLIPELGHWRYFDESGKLLRTGFVTGGDGYVYYYENDALVRGLSKIGDDYYMFNAGSGKMYRDATMWVPANDYGVEIGMHYFDADGKMFIPNLETGVKKIIEENGKLYLTIDGVKMTNGLNELDGELYYSLTSGELVTGTAIWVSQKNGLIPELGNWRYFDESGKLQRTGFVDAGDGYTYYYDNDDLVRGFTKLGDDYYMFNAGSGKMYRDATMWVPANDYGVEIGLHYFDAEGKMFIPNLETGVKKIIEENGKLYLTIDGVKLTNGLNEFDGDLYYAQTSGELARGTAIWASQKNGLIPEKGYWRYFDENGKLLRTGFVTGGDGCTYHYTDDVLDCGFTRIDGEYYMFNANSGKMYSDATMWVGENNYGIEGGMYYFDADGKMIG